MAFADVTPAKRETPSSRCFMLSKMVAPAMDAPDAHLTKHGTIIACYADRNTVMALKQINIRVDEETAAQLKLRSTIENRSVNEIVGESLREYSKNHPVSREDMLALVRAIAKEDASLLKALAQE